MTKEEYIDYKLDQLYYNSASIYFQKYLEFAKKELNYKGKYNGS